MIAINKKNLKCVYNGLKSSAKKRGIEFDIDMVDLNNISWPLTCPVLNIPLAFNNGRVRDNSYSFDRINSSKGYTIDNIVIISMRANKLKSDATLDELIRLYKFYFELEELKSFTNDFNDK